MMDNAATSPNSNSQDIVRQPVEIFKKQTNDLDCLGNLDLILSTASEFTEDDLHQCISFAQDLAPTTLCLQMRLWLLSHLFSLLDDMSSDPSYLEQAISLARAAIEPPNPVDPRIEHDLSRLLYASFEAGGPLEELSEAILLTEKALAALSSHFPRRTPMLEVLACRYSDRHQRLGTPEDFKRAIELAQQVLVATPVDDENRGGRLTTLGSLLVDRYDDDGNIEDLQIGISLTTEALTVPCPHLPDRPKRYSNLSVFLLKRYECTKTMQDLDEAIRLGEEALAMTAPEDADRMIFVGNLGKALAERYDVHGDVNDVQRHNALQAEVYAVLYPGPEIGVGDPAELMEAAELRWISYKEAKDLEQLQRAIELAQRAIQETEEHDPGQPQKIWRLGWFTWEKYNCLNMPEDLNDAIRHTRHALTLSATQKFEGRISALENLGSMLFRRYDEMYEFEDLESAIATTEEALGCISVHDEQWAGTMSNLGFFLLERYQARKIPADLNRALLATSQSLGETLTDDLQYAQRLGIRGVQLRFQFELHGNPADLDQAIDCLQSTLAKWRSETKIKLHFVTNLAFALHRRYQQTEALADLDNGIRWIKEAAASPVRNHVVHAGILQHLASSLNNRYQRLGIQDDLDDSLKLLTEALSLIPEDYPERCATLMNISICYSSRYRQFSGIDDLEAAVTFSEQALAATPPNYPYRASILLAIGISREARYARFKNLNDLDEAMVRTTDALEASFLQLSSLSINVLYPPWDMDEDFRSSGIASIFTAHETTTVEHTRAIALCNLGHMHCARYAELGELEDLQKAVSRCEEAVTTIATNHPSRPMFLSHLSVSLHMRFQRLNILEDLEKSIKLRDEAVMSIPLDHPQRPGMFGHLARGLDIRYQRLGGVKDLDRAIELTSNAPPKDIDEELALKSVGARYWARYQRFEALDDLEKAVKWTEAALALTPRGHGRRAETLSNLGNMLCAWYLRSAIVADIEKAVKLSEEALDLTPLRGIDRAYMLTNLGSNLGARYKGLDTVEDLDRAIQVTREALDITPADHPDRPSTLDCLAEWFQLKYRLLESPNDLDAAINYAEQAVTAIAVDNPYRAEESWRLVTAKPITRLDAAQAAASLLRLQEKWNESWAFLRNAVELMPQVSPRWLRRDDQQYVLSKLGRLTSDAVSIALEAGQAPSLCLRILELGRGIIVGLTIDCRSDISELKEKHEHVYEKYDRLRTEIDSPFPSQRRRDAVGDMEETVAYIRQLPGFSLFQLPPSAESIMEMAHNGPIIIVNSTKLRSDALVVTSSSIKLIGLPGLVNDAVEVRVPEMATLAQGTRASYPSRNHALKKSLLWLWNTTVEPILNELQLGDVSEHEAIYLPHVWWIGVGTLALAPFHAAGDHSPLSTRNTMSRVVSSYITTIKSLSYAREKRMDIMSNSDGHLLLVTMPTTPGKNPLPNAIPEAQGVKDEVNERITLNHLNHPSAADVLQAIPSYHCVHFSCHGVSDSSNPSNSHLMLVKPGSNQESETLDVLTVDDISRTNINRAQLAYLSACSTAQKVPGALADEALHIAAGFQLSGFSHVIATMWESNDGACRQVAKDFYKTLFDGEGNDDGHRKVRIALHRAVNNLRRNFWRQPILWASYIHTGA